MSIKMKIEKERILVMWCYLWLLALTACGAPVVIDDGDAVTVDCKYSFIDGTSSSASSMQVIAENEWDSWMYDVIMWAKVWDVLTWTINSMEQFPEKYDPSKTQIFPNIIMTEVLGIQNPEIWNEVYVEGFGTGFILEQNVNEEWYNEFLVDFNDPKYYSDVEYEIQIKDIEKR